MCIVGHGFYRCQQCARHSRDARSRRFPDRTPHRRVCASPPGRAAFRGIVLRLCSCSDDTMVVKRQADAAEISVHSSSLSPLALRLVPGDRVLRARLADAVEEEATVRRKGEGLFCCRSLASAALDGSAAAHRFASMHKTAQHERFLRASRIVSLDFASAYNLCPGHSRQRHRDCGHRSSLNGSGSCVPRMESSPGRPAARWTRRLQSGRPRPRRLRHRGQLGVRRFDVQRHLDVVQGVFERVFAVCEPCVLLARPRNSSVRGRRVRLAQAPLERRLLVARRRVRLIRRHRVCLRRDVVRHISAVCCVLHFNS